MVIRELRSKHCHGTILVEFALAFPVFLLLILGSWQLVMLSSAQSMLDLAAFRAARSQAVQDKGFDNPDPKLAVAHTLGCITGPSLPLGFSLPDLGFARRLGREVESALSQRIALLKTEVNTQSDERFHQAEVTHHFELVVPVAGSLFLLFDRKTNADQSSSESDPPIQKLMAQLYQQVPHLTLNSQCRLARIHKMEKPEPEPRRSPWNIIFEKPTPEHDGNGTTETS